MPLHIVGESAKGLVLLPSQKVAVVIDTENIKEQNDNPMACIFESIRSLVRDGRSRSGCPVTSIGKKEIDGQAVTIQQTTLYPWDGAVALALEVEKPHTFTLNLRLPGWCPKYHLEINGAPQLLRPDSNGYLAIQREWQDGDTITLRLPMELSVHTWAKNKNSVSVDYGPLSFSLAISAPNRIGTANWISAPSRRRRRRLVLRQAVILVIAEDVVPE